MAYGRTNVVQSPKDVFQRLKFEGKCLKFRRAIIAKFQAPRFENSEPEKVQFHNPAAILHRH